MVKILLMIFVGATGVFLTSDADKKFVEIKRPFVSPPAHIERFTLGYRDPIADVFWIRLLQDLGACRYSGEVQDLPGDKVLSCNKGWSYRMADVVTTLSPKFKMAYSASALLLSIAGGDPEGAKLIYEKALQQFPNDWGLHYNAAYHYIVELKDHTRAAELMNRAGQLGAPPWVFALAARLYGRDGQVELARRVLTDYLETNPTGYGADRARQRLKEIDLGLIGDKEVRDGETTPNHK